MVQIGQKLFRIPGLTLYLDNVALKSQQKDLCYFLGDLT